MLVAASACVVALELWRSESDSFARRIGNRLFRVLTSTSVLFELFRTIKSRAATITIMRFSTEHTVDQPVEESFSGYPIGILRKATRTTLPPSERIRERSIHRQIT